MRKLPLLFAGLAVALAACGPTAGQPGENSPPAPAPATPPPSATAPQAGISAPAPTGKSLQPQLADADIDLSEVVALLPPDAIRAIAPEEVPHILVTAAEANAGGIPPDVNVIGIEVGGESHAYPLPYLSAHEIVNVDIGGRHLAVTW